MKYLMTVFLSLVCMSAFATNVSITPPQATRPMVVFSTTVDWEAVTGLTLNQYKGKIKGTDRSFVKDGVVLYYLDSFPCYGEASNVRIWVSPKGTSTPDLRLVCLYKPEKVVFAWRNAGEDASDARTTGILTCPITGDRDFTIDIAKCERGKDWKDM